MTGLSRRDLLIRAGAAGIALPSVLAACGGDDSGSDATTAPTSGTSTAGATTAPTSQTTGAGEPLGDTVRVLNWVLYIENDDASTSPTLKNFTSATGVKVDYRPELDDNDAFYAKFQPDMAAGRDIGFDLVVPTSWMAARLISEGLVLPLDPARVPNKANIRDDLASPSWDPTRQYSLPWAQGQTGIAYFPDKTGRPVTSAADLLDPEFKNRVSILTEWRDTVGLLLLDRGVSPQTATMDEIRAVIEVIGTARDAGQFRKIVGNSYTDDLITGEVWVAIGWSGDIASLKAGELPDIEYVLPAKGAMSFVDNAMIPAGAKNKAEAEAFLNFVYDPAVSGPLFEAITYVSPVEGAVDFMTAAGKANPFVNPPQGSKLYEFREVTPEEEEEIVELFTEATQL